MFFLALIYLASVSLFYKFLFFNNYLFIHLEASIVVLEKNLFEFSKALIHWLFKKIAAPKFIGNFSVKHPWYDLS